MRLRHTFPAKATIVALALLVLGLTGARFPEASGAYKLVFDRIIVSPVGQFILPESCKTSQKTYAPRSCPDSVDKILMLHPRTLTASGTEGPMPLNGTNYFVQTNYDGFSSGGDRHRAQTFAIQQFTRTSDGGEKITELYAGVEAGDTNRSEVW
ncbi:hypothetical protein J7M28_12050, partial [bacterium]|nr:hypothetical protein [bacterium]